jgi:hypothetical protein
MNELPGDDDVVRDVTIQEVILVSLLGALGGCISRPTKAVQSV